MRAKKGADTNCRLQPRPARAASHGLRIQGPPHSRSSATSLPPPALPAQINDVAISGSTRPPGAVQMWVLAGVQSMESVVTRDVAEAGGGVRVGAFAPPGCYRAWPPPLRHTDVAGPPCTGSVCAAGRRPTAPASARVSVPPRPQTPRQPAWRSRPGSAPRLGQFARLPFPNPEPSFRVSVFAVQPAQLAGTSDSFPRPWFCLRP